VLRIQLEQLKSIRRNLQAELVMRPEWLNNELKLSLVQSDVDLEELKLRELALDGFAELGLKTPIPGIGVQEHGFVQYDREKALEWCRKNLPAAVIETVDEPTFEATVQALPANVRPAFVVTGKTPKATISATLHEKVDPEQLMALLPRPEDIYTPIVPEDKYPADWPELRQKVFERDHRTCQRCKRAEALLLTLGLELECDHVIPLAWGGDNAMHNLRTLCSECHPKMQIRVPENLEEVGDERLPDNR